MGVSKQRHVLENVGPIEQKDTVHLDLAWELDVPCRIRCGRRTCLLDSAPLVQPQVFASLEAGTVVHEAVRQANNCSSLSGSNIF